MEIRSADISDLNAIIALENECFPQAEAAARENIRDRLNEFPNYFLLLTIDDKLVSFVNGMLTDEENLRDEMYENASFHNAGGKWMMIFGVATSKSFRGRGYASDIINKLLERLRIEKRAGAVLTCKEHLIEFYEKLGFINEGASKSNHGGAAWYQMRFVIKENL